MSRATDPQASSSAGRGRAGLVVLGEYFAVFPYFARKYGLKALGVLCLAAAFAFAPLAVLYWWNEVRIAGVLTTSLHGPVQVKAGQLQEEQEREEPGETALLQVVCEVISFGAAYPLLQDADPRRQRGGQFDSWFVTREAVFLRPAGAPSAVPFALLGRPPVSVWLPAGEYELLVVHGVPRDEFETDPRGNFPLAYVFAEFALENKQKTTVRIPLPHYGPDKGRHPRTPADRVAASADLQPFLRACEEVAAVATPGGYSLALPEPVVHHDSEHQNCTIDFSDLRAVPREWTREQLAMVRNWLPADATAPRARFSALIDALSWRRFLQGWFCYAAAVVTGVIFTRWGAIAMLEPWRHGESFGDNVVLLIKVGVAAIVLWCVFQFLSGA